MTWRRRLDRLEAHAPPPVPLLTAEQRAAGVLRILEEAERPTATTEMKERAAKVREILTRAEARRDAAQAHGWTP
jgi:hypothetical protein